VTPDIVLPSVLNVSKDIGESALDNPLPWDAIASAKYERLDWVAPYLEELRRRSAARVQSCPDFAYVREDVEQFLKMQEDRSISLNEQARLREKQEQEARRKARARERQARNQPEIPVRELTLADVDKPGLPPPLSRTNRLSQASSDPGGPVGTNDLMVASRTASASSGDAEPAAPLDEESDPLAPDEPLPPATDFVLREAEMILVDYLRLWPKERSLTARKETPAAVPAAP